MEAAIPTTFVIWLPTINHLNNLVRSGHHAFCFETSYTNLVITIKIPQMYQVANYGLCLMHSLKTHATFGFMFGCNMNYDKNWGKMMGDLKRPTYLKLHGPRISKLIRSAVSNWGHPLLLPVILLEDHVYNADRYKGLDLSQATNKLEEKLMVTNAGRNAGITSSLNFGALGQKLTADSRFEIITNINTTITDAVTFTGNLKWDNRYCQFLRDICHDIKDFTKTTQGREAKLENTIETLATLVISISEHAEAIKSRLDIQLDVVCDLFHCDDSKS